jgi:hypothetical protein
MKPPRLQEGGETAKRGAADRARRRRTKTRPRLQRAAKKGGETAKRGAADRAGRRRTKTRPRLQWAAKKGGEAAKRGAAAKRGGPRHERGSRLGGGQSHGKRRHAGGRRMVRGGAGGAISAPRDAGHLAGAGRPRCGKDAAGRGMGERHGARAAAVCRACLRAGGAGGRNACRRARRDDRGPFGHPRHGARRPASLRAQPPAGLLRQWRGGADFLLRGSGQPARPAVRGRVVRRAWQMAAPGRHLRHAAVRPEARQAAAPDHHHHAAPAAAGAKARRRQSGDGDPDAHGGKRRAPGGRVP